MARKRQQRLHIEMNYQKLTDAERQVLIGEVKAVAPQSTIYGKVGAIQTSVTALGTKGAALQAQNEMVAADRKKLGADLDTEVNVRAEVDKEIRTLQTLVESNATDEADLTGMAFKKRGPRPPKPAVTIPASIDVKMPKRAKGYVDVSAHETGKIRNHYDAEWSPEAITTTSWLLLVGKGKSRRVSGASGTKVWVRFAMVRGQTRSEWCTPVLVTIP